MFRRLPIESARPLVVFATARLAIAVAALLAVLVLGFPYGGRGAAVVGGLAVPWAVGCLVVARREPERLLSPFVAATDLLILLLLELVVPETYGAVRLAALFMIAAHAHFQGEFRGVMVALLGSAALVAASAVRGDTPLPSDVHAFYETVFVLSCLATGLVVGSLRTAESASRLRARGLSRRTIQAEAEVRRRVAESIHDGPVQELIGLDMMLSSARKAAYEGRGDDATQLLDEARVLTERNITRAPRRDSWTSGPYAFGELAFETAIENCMPIWKRRYGLEVMATIDHLDLPAETAGVPVRHRPGGGRQRRSARGRGHGGDLAAHRRLERRAARDRQRRRLPRRRPARRVGARSPRSGDDARARRAARRDARHRDLATRHACPGARAAPRAPALGRVQSQPRSVAIRTACALSTAPSLA